jgi:electron transport complex protein RnfE
MALGKEFTKGIFKENPVLVFMLGLCPVLAVSTSAFNGLGMGVSATFVLLGSNIVVSLLAPVIPRNVRIPCYISVIATFVTIVDLVLHAYAFQLWLNLGLFIPLIVVNCVILGRAEAFASKRGVIDSIVDALGMGLGFTVVLFVLGAIREFFGNGTITLYQMGETTIQFGALQGKFAPAILMILPPGAFITLGILTALNNILLEKLGKA